MIRRVAILLASIGLPHSAWAATSTTQTCAVVDANGAARKVSFTFDSLAEMRRVGFSYLGGSGTMPLPKTATNLVSSEGYADFLIETDSGKFRLWVYYGGGYPLTVKFAPYVNAKMDKGFVGFCRPSKSEPSKLLEVGAQAIKESDQAGLGLVGLVSSADLTCKFVTSEMRYVDGGIEISPGLRGSLFLPFSLRVDGALYRDEIPSLSSIGQGDHQLIVGLFSAGDKDKMIVGRINSLEFFDWVQFGPAKDSKVGPEFTGVCRDRVVQGQNPK